MALSATAVAVPLLATVAIGAAGAAIVTGGNGSHATAKADARAVAAPDTTARGTTPAGSGLAADVARLQARLRQVPRDWESWAALGLDYVQQARVTVDPTYYPKAEQSLTRSLQLNSKDNVIGAAGEASLAAARHEFRSALSWSRRGLAIDPHSGVLLGTLCDALTQLGDYGAAQKAAAAMEAVDPGTSAEARLSYAAELRGDLPAARSLMQIALGDSGSADDVAFTRYYLGDLAFSSGDAQQALRDYEQGLLAAPAYTALLEGRARAEAALGRTANALRDFARVVDEVPMPSYVVEYGDLLASVGRQRDAAAQYELVRTEEKLFRANGVTLDSDAALFEADHGNAQAAVSIGRAAIRSRPFVDSYDAFGWALHRAGRDRDALTMLDKALATGAHNALFLYHRGVVEDVLGDRAAARADLTAALRTNPHFNPLAAPAALRLLRTLR